MACCHTPALPLTVCVTLAKPLNLSRPQFPYLYLGAVPMILTSDGCDVTSSGNRQHGLDAP